MLVSMNWLKEFVPLSLDPEDLADTLTQAGVAVESVIYPGAGIKNVVSGRILAVEKHKDADRLFICRVDAGGEELQIVTGASNVFAGALVPVALEGARLASGHVIKRSKLRGVLSRGMLCSGQELGLETKLLSSDQQHGIMILPEDTPVGVPIVEILGLDDAVLELDLTPNRGDCLSVYGVAREVAALLHLPLSRPAISPAPEIGGGEVGVENLAPALCKRYTACLVRGVTAGPSPMWLQQRLRLAGIRPLSNVVDVTNYVMLELGQPLHAFDYSRLQDGRVIVRTAKSGEKIVTLDGVARDLTEEMLVIADPAGPVAIAGVMGGQNSEVSSGTTDVLLESACFDASSVRRTSRLLTLRSESSLRFERGVDPNGCLNAAARAAALLQELAGGQRARSHDVYPQPVAGKTIMLRPDRANRILGIEIDREEISSSLTGLGFGVDVPSGGEMVVEVPTFRPDITAEVDLLEEIARIHGYRNFPDAMLQGIQAQGGRPPMQNFMARVADQMSSCGFREVVTMSLVSPRAAELLSGGRQAVMVKNPMSEEQSALRTSLVPGLLDVLKRNYNRQCKGAAIFELGRVFDGISGKRPVETEMLAAAAMGQTITDWRMLKRPYDFYFLKETILVLVGQLHLSGVEFIPHAAGGYHPGRCAALSRGETHLGVVGELHPNLLENYGLPAHVVAMELNLQEIFRHARGVPLYQSLPRFPAVERDLAVVIDKKVPAGEVKELVWRQGSPLLKDLFLFDIYQGVQVPENCHSLAFKLFFWSPDHTLTDSEVNNHFDAILEALAEKWQARIRR